MRAMILAAGNGTGLRPLTLQIPKALVEVRGVSALEAIVGKLKAAGVTDIIINVHHHARQIEAFVCRRGNFGIRVDFSREPELLDTGGGLKAARRFFCDRGPFFVHNADILTDMDLRAMMTAHRKSGDLATLAVQTRRSDRLLLIDEEGLMCGHVDRQSGIRRLARRPRGRLRARAFCGVHVLSPEIFEVMEDEGRFSIIGAYLGLIEKGFAVRAFDADSFFWRDIGRVESLRSMRRETAQGRVPPSVLEAPPPADIVSSGRARG